MVQLFRLRPPPPWGQSILIAYEKFKKGVGNMVQGQVFLKGGGGAGPLALFLFNFQDLSFLHLEITLPFAKLCYAFEEKLFFSSTIIL